MLLFKKLLSKSYKFFERVVKNSWMPFLYTGFFICLFVFSCFCFLWKKEKIQSWKSTPIHSMSQEEGFAFVAFFPHLPVQSFSSYLPIQVWEKGKPLSLERSSLEEVRKKGKGRYCLLNGVLYFSASDNTNPQKNGRLYEFYYPQKISGPISFMIYSFEAFLIFFFSLLTIFFFHFEKEKAKISMDRNVRFLIWGGLLLLLFSALRYSLETRPYIESVDFFTHLCFCSNLLQDPEKVSMIRYFYFPGVYTFWKAVMLSGLHSLSQFQWTYLLLLFANAFFTGAIVYRMSSSVKGSIFAIFWYLSLCSRLEGFQGCTEPMATLFILIAFFFWKGKTFKGQDGLFCSAILGIGIGLALYGKQQGGLLALGALAFIPTMFFAKEELRHEFKYLLLLPLWSLLVFILAILAEGYGLQPISIGLQSAYSYEIQGDLWQNLKMVFTHSKDLFFALVLMLVLWFANIFFKNSPWPSGTNWMEILGFALFATLSSLWQFTKRPYLHYMFLSAPLVVLAATIMMIEVGRLFKKEEKKALFFAFLLWVLMLVPLWQYYPEINLPTWEVALGLESPPIRHWRNTPEVARDIQILQKIIPPQRSILVLPPRRYEMDFFLQALSRPNPQTYEALLFFLNSVKPEYIIVLDFRSQTDQKFWEKMECDLLCSQFPQYKYHLFRKLSTMTLYKLQ